MTVTRLSMLCVVCFLSLYLPPYLDAQEKIKPAEPAVAKDTRQSLLGAWALAGPPDSKNDPQPGARMKFWGLKHWVITQSNPDTGELVFHHGGTYTLDGDNYSETIKFAAPNTTSMIGTTLKFKIKVEGDTYTQTGVGNLFNERWVRLKE